jgi:hypothetical protein
MGTFRRGNPSSNEFFDGQHRFEHWYRDNTIYFITARCRDRFAAFASEEAKRIFWNRYDHYTRMHGYQPFVTTLLDNHYHSLGYLLEGSQLGEMMRKIHGSVAKLVNDTLPERRVPFWGDGHHDDYFDGCIRDVLQYTRAYPYTLNQAVRARIVKHYRDYPHTHVPVELESGLILALERHAFLEKVPYARYERREARRCAQSRH